MRFALLLLLPLATVIAADQSPPSTQRQLDPSKPADALVIIDLLTKHATWPGQDRDQVAALERSIATLAALIQPKLEPVEVKKP